MLVKFCRENKWKENVFRREGLRWSQLRLMLSLQCLSSCCHLIWDWHYLHSISSLCSLQPLGRMGQILFMFSQHEVVVSQKKCFKEKKRRGARIKLMKINLSPEKKIKTIYKNMEEIKTIEIDSLFLGQP